MDRSTRLLSLVVCVTALAQASGYYQLAAGLEHTLALRTGGTVQAWGDNFYGQLGNGANAD